LAKDIIENTVWLGISNLYGRFDTDITLGYLEDVITIMVNQKIRLPDFSIIANCSIKNSDGWGQVIDMSSFEVE
jgi:hypothetical protein